MRVVLTAEELNALYRQPATTMQDGGWQRLLVTLQRKTNRSTGELVLDADDRERIARYAFDYKNGGWQRRMKQIFGRTLGPTLGSFETTPIFPD
jgi:hypothetical protein